MGTISRHLPSAYEMKREGDDSKVLEAGAKRMLNQDNAPKANDKCVWTKYYTGVWHVSWKSLSAVC